MSPAPPRLAVDLSTNLLRVLEGSMGGPMRCGAAELPREALSGGKVVDPAMVGQTLKQLVARSEMVETRAVVGVSDSIGTFRVLELPATATNKDVDAAVAKQMPMDPERLSTMWVDAGVFDGSRVVYAVAWDRGNLKNLTDAIRAAGLEPSVVEPKSAALARITSEPSCVIVDLSYEPAEIVLVDRHIPQLWHAFELDTQQLTDVAAALARPIRSLIRFYKRERRSGFGHGSPVLVSSEIELLPHTLGQLSDLIDHPVRSLDVAPRVPPNVRHSTYLTCLGLVMRRS